jgi:hypothetical protein
MESALAEAKERFKKKGDRAFPLSGEYYGAINSLKQGRFRRTIHAQNLKQQSSCNSVFPWV